MHIECKNTKIFADMPLILYLCRQNHSTMLHTLLSLLLFVPLPSLDADMQLLSQALDRKGELDARYEQRLDSLRKEGDPKKLYKAFNSYCYDSALYYVQQVVEACEMRGDYDDIVRNRIKLAYVYMLGGRFEECEAAFNVLDEAQIPPHHKTGYYSLRGHLLYDIARYEEMPYPPLMRHYYETALAYVLPNDSVGRYNLQAQLARIDHKDSLAIRYFEQALQGSAGNLHGEAIFLSSIAQVYYDRADSAQALHYWSQAAVRDIQSSTKEVLAMQQVAQLLHRLGQQDMAYRCIRSALEDARHFHARHRQLEVGEIIPIIDSYQIEELHRHNRRIRILYAGIVLLLLTGVVGLVRMLHKLHQRNARLSEAQEKIRLANIALENSNIALEQSNHIKETYLTAMLSAEADHTIATEQYVRHVMHCAREKDWKELLNTPAYINKLGQRTAFYRRFDTMFLQLYPHFVDEINSMLSQPLTGKDGTLPSELRVFALIRLGQSNNEQIAHILSCSLATIHTYKARVYAQLTVPKQEFLTRVGAIAE